MTCGEHRKRKSRRARSRGGCGFGRKGKGSFPPFGKSRPKTRRCGWIRFQSSLEDTPRQGGVGAGVSGGAGGGAVEMRGGRVEPFGELFPRAVFLFFFGGIDSFSGQAPGFDVGFEKNPPPPPLGILLPCDHSRRSS